MIIFVLLFSILLPVILFASALETLFTSDELANMGVCMAYTQDGSKVS
jgi:hypothetical protein